MRKFFKGLAVLLALTLIVGVIPAAAADSLSMAKEKVLYLDGSKGQKEDGTQCKTSYKKLVANMIKGFDKDTMSVVLSSADKSIVSTTKAGRIVAKSLGTTTVTVAVYDAAETEIFKQDLKVIVKKNAAEVTVTGIADGDKVKVGQTVDVTLPRAGVDTDARELTVDKAENVEITAGEKARTWTVKFVKAGDVTFTARAYQSAKYPATTAKKEIKVSVSNPAPTAIKVVASNAYELTFDTDVEAAGLFKDAKEIANDACYYMLNDTKVTFSAVKKVEAKGNTVKVTMYDNYAAGTTYYVVVNESEPLQFVIAGNAAKDVESIAIISDSAVVNTASPITVALYNADGVDITSSVGTGSVSLTSTNLNSYVDGLTLNMYNVGDVTDLTATFVYYDANNNYQEVKKTTTKKITAVAASADVFKALVYSVDNKADLPNKNYSGAKTYLALGDTGYKFKVQLVYTNANNEFDFAVNGVNTFNGKALYAKIPEESVALLSSNNGDGTYDIVPNTVGSTNVFIGYDDNGTFKTVAVAPIQVKEARYPATLTVKPTKSNLNTSVTDSITFNAEVKD
ncbi:MAG: Ig-like domain-containing protein [Lachnospiraceae bacterium]|nr:Ig-like domain-containing protein [Lachnospiraceae bacterium]